MPNALYYGDNLNVLRESIASESVDLVYLDPPFNSQASYNLLFKPRLAWDRARRLRPLKTPGNGDKRPSRPFWM